MATPRETKQRYRALYPAKWKEQRRREKWKARYGIKWAEYAALLEAQGGVCAICRRPEMSRSGNGDRTRTLAIDHDHATGEVRGLLCHSCNVALGSFQDDPERLRRAADYAEFHKTALCPSDDLGPWGIDGCVGLVS